MDSKPVIAAFDFDGTITTKDTLFDFIRFYFGKIKLLQGLIILSPMLMLFRVGIIQNSEAKGRLLSYFFKGHDIAEFNQKSEEYSSQISRICKPDVLNKIKWHKNEGHTIIIVSASVRNWIEPWAKQNGFEQVLGTELEVIDNKITGRFATPNCYGPEKVNRLLQLFPNRAEYTLFAYGDSSGDKELLAIADHAHLMK